MKLAALKEDNENRSPLTIKTVEKFINLGFAVLIEKDIGKKINISNEEFENAKAKVISNKKDLLKDADIIIKVNAPSIEDISLMKKNSLFISFIDTFFEKDILNKFLKENVNAISLQLLPRSTFAQKMDALSSQSSLAGYASIILASYHYIKILPMMTTPAGTISPAKVFIVGAGVAGLQAVATAKRLGAKVEVYDTRKVTEEQVRSLGAKFFKIEMEDTQTKEGYAKELTKEELQKQRNALKKAISSSDIVITTAQVFGKKAPLIVTEDIMKEMKKGSIIIDLAISSGGNVEFSKKDEIIDMYGVKIIAPSNILNDVAFDASLMLSSNFYNLAEYLFDKEKKELKMNLNDEILKSSLISFEGKIISPFLKKE